MKNVQTPVKRTFWRTYVADEAGMNLSWASVIAGVVTFFSVLLLLSFIGTSLGFGLLSPTSNDPLAGVGTGLIVWALVSLLLSFAAAGFVSGLASRKAGLLHGFLTWALSMVLFFALLTSTVSSVMGLAGRFVSSALGTATQAVSSVAQGAGDLIGQGLDALGQQIGQVDLGQLNADTQKVLRDTEVPELQPEYLNNQLTEVKGVLTNLAKKVATEPDQAKAHLEATLKDLADRAKKIGQSADREAIKKAVAKNTQLNQAEADKTVENTYEGIQKLSQQAQEQVENLKVGLEKAEAQLNETVQQARQTAENATDAVSKTSIYVFIGLLLAMILTAFMGIVGSRQTREVEVMQA